MWGEENRPDPPEPTLPVAGFSDEDLDAQRGHGDGTQPDETLEPPDASEPEPDAEQKPATVHHLIRYDVNDERIAELRAQFAPLAERTPENYEPRRKAIATTRELRVSVEKKRKQLKEDSIRWGRKVDDVARHYREALEAIEEPLQLAKDADDAEKERIKAEKAAVEKAALEAKVRAEREAEEAKLKAEREAEEARLAEERAELERQKVELAEKQRQADEANRAERERVEAEQAAERKRLDEEGEKLKREREAQAEAARLEREQLEADRRALAEARQQAEREEAERQAKIRAEADAKERAERERVAAEEARVAELERQAAIAKRLEALKPDREKLAAYAQALRMVPVPELATPEAQAALLEALGDIGQTAERLEAFGSEAP